MQSRSVEIVIRGLDEARDREQTIIPVEGSQCRDGTAAAKLEYKALKSKNTFRIVKQSSQSKPLPLKWHFTYKFDQEGYLTKYKACICVRGDLQPISLQETYAATLAFRVFRALMALTAAFGLIAEQLDAVSAFLNAKLDEEVYVQFSEGFEEDPNSCLQLL